MIISLMVSHMQAGKKNDDRKGFLEKYIYILVKDTEVHIVGTVRTEGF